MSDNGNPMFSWFWTVNYRRGFFRLWLAATLISIAAAIISAADELLSVPWYKGAEEFVFSPGTPIYMQHSVYDENNLPENVEKILTTDKVVSARNNIRKQIILRNIGPVAVVSFSSLVILQALIWVIAGFRPRKS